LSTICEASGLAVADQTEQRFARYGRECLQKQKLELGLEELRGSLWEKL
jgi:hypothetical protein